MIGFIARIFGGNVASAWIAVIMAAGIASYVGVLKFDIWQKENQIEDLKVENKRLELDVAHEKGEVKACKSRIQETNNRIEDLKSDRKKVVSILTENLNMFRELSESRINNIKDAPTPQNCEEAMEFLREGLRSLDE